MAIEKVLIVDDEPLVRDFLKETLRRKNLDVTVAENGRTALAYLKENTFDMIITDMKMPDITGIDVLREAKKNSPSTIVVVITAFGSIENAVEAMKIGAFNYVIKPFSPDTIEAIVDKANQHLSLVAENNYLREQVSSSDNHTLIAESSIMKTIIRDLEKAAKSNANVMITGESGTGKEEIAYAIYANSFRKNGPYIKVNCAAIPETLIESEFFGHEKGAFTGAHAKHLGRFELANGGTLLLDEVTEVPLALQAKLLRAVQEQEFERVGGTKPVKVDVRIISTSNRNLQEAIAQKILRDDLYYRLNVIPIVIPPLRDRSEDILPLARYFIAKACKANSRKPKTLSREAEQLLLSYSWPGNIRELGNIIERAVVMDNGDTLNKDQLHLDASLQLTGTISNTAGMSLHEMEKKMIIETLQAQKFNRTKTAKVLGISVRTLRNKLHQYELTELKEPTPSS